MLPVMDKIKESDSKIEEAQRVLTTATEDIQHASEHLKIQIDQKVQKALENQTRQITEAREMLLL